MRGADGGRRRCTRGLNGDCKPSGETTTTAGAQCFDVTVHLFPGVPKLDTDSTVGLGEWLICRRYGVFVIFFILGYNST